MKIFLVISSIAALSGCAATQQAPALMRISTTPYALNVAEVREVQSKVASRLKDPEAARFGNILAVRHDDIVEVCGKVNAKNSFGGYVGEHPFYGTMPLPSRTFFPIGVGGDHASSEASYAMCRDFGIDLR